MVGSFTYRHARIVMVLAFSGLISACGGGGGGGDEPKPDPVAKLQSVDGPYTALETRETANGTQRIHIQVTSTDTATVAASFELNAYSPEVAYPAPLWYTTRHLRADADGLGATDLGPSQLVMVQKGSLMALDLSAKQLGTARRLSTLRDVCAMERTAQQLHPDGKQAWVLIFTAGPDRSCATPADNPFYLVSTTMSETDTPVSASGAGLQLLAVLSQPTQEAQGILVRDYRTGDLAVYDNTLKNRKYVVRPGMLGIDDKANALAEWPTRAQSGLIQLGTAIHAMDWRSGTLTLGPALATIDQQFKKIAVARNAQSVYVAFDNKSLVLDASGNVSHQTEFPAFNGPITEVWPTQSGFAVMQVIPEGLPNAGASALYAFHTSTGIHEGRQSASADARLHIVAVTGDTVLLSQRTGLKSDFWRDIYSLNMVGDPAPQWVALQVNLFAQSRSSHIKPGRDPIEQLLWCAPTLMVPYCLHSEVFSYDVASRTPTSLGMLGDLGGAKAATLSDGGLMPLSGQTAFIVVTRIIKEGETTDAVWSLKPASEQSLRMAKLLPS